MPDRLWFRLTVSRSAQSLRMLFKDISPEKIFNFLKFKFEIVSFQNFNLRSFLVMFMFSPFKHGFKTVYRPILRHTHYSKLNIQYEVCIALI